MKPSRNLAKEFILNGIQLEKKLAVKSLPCGPNYGQVPQGC